MRFSLDVLRARKGDCLMLHYGTPEDPHLILIDGGPSGVYQPQLRPRLAGVHQARELEEEDPLPVDIVMISHLDDDHLKGILELTKEQRGVPELRLSVTSLWHNSFDDLLDTRPEELKTGTGFGVADLGGRNAFDAGQVLAGFGAAALNGGAPIEDHDAFDAAKVLASIPQTRQLQDDAEFLHWEPNHAFEGRLILATAAAQPVTLDGGLKLTVVGPMQPELLALQEAYDKWLREQEAKRKNNSEAALAAFSDTSIPNLSSIVVLAEAGGKRMLLTSDARGDKIMKGLELVGLLQPGGTMHVDVLKVPHHGSSRNVRQDFFERVTADHYIFSGNGKHGNPERAALEMLLEARPGAPFTIHLTYPPEEIDLERRKDWEEQQASENDKRARKPETEVRPDWSHAEHGLKALLNSRLAPGQGLTIVADRQPHVIDLLVPLAF